MVPKTCFLLLSALVVLSNAFSATRTFGPRMITIEAPRTKTETEKKNRNRGGSRQTDTDPIPESEGYVDNALEWFIDDDEISREDDEPFHILLLNSTYAKPRITLQYVASSCSYVLGMPMPDAEELAEIAKLNGMSCLGTWSHKECMVLGRQLQQRDLVVRVVPFCEGGERFWQTSGNLRDASADRIMDAGGFD